MRRFNNAIKGAIMNIEKISKEFNIDFDYEIKKEKCIEVLREKDIIYCGECKKYTKHYEYCGDVVWLYCGRCDEKERRAKNIKKIKKRRKAERKFILGE